MKINIAMNSPTMFFGTKSMQNVLLFGVLFFLFSFFTTSVVNAQNISELNQFLKSPDSEKLRIDEDFLFGSQTVIFISQAKIKMPEEGSPRKAEVQMSAIGRLSQVGEDLETVEILQLKIASESDKSGIVPASVLGEMPSLKVVLIISEVPISLAEVQKVVSAFESSSVKILYLYSEPV